MKKNQIFLGFLTAGLILVLAGCKTAEEERAEREAEAWKRMTPEEREYATAEKRAKERFLSDAKLPETPPERRAAKPAKEKKSFFNFTRHSKEKRDKLWNMDRPVLMESTTDDVYPWKSGSQPRSEQMSESHLDRLR